jgi:hypothetical protein
MWEEVKHDVIWKLHGFTSKKEFNECQALGLESKENYDEHKSIEYAMTLDRMRNEGTDQSKQGVNEKLQSKTEDVILSPTASGKCARVTSQEGVLGKEDLVRFKRKIKKYLKSGDTYTINDVKDFLASMQQQQASYQDLEETGIALTIKKLRTESTAPELQRNAKLVLKKWKRQMKDRLSSKSNLLSSKSLLLTQKNAKVGSDKSPHACSAGVAAFPDKLVSVLDSHRLACVRGIFRTLHKVWEERNFQPNSPLENIGLDTIQNQAVAIENATYHLHPNSQEERTSTLRSISSNLAANFELFCQLVHGIVTSTELVAMPREELAPAVIKERLKQLTKDVINERRSDYQEANQAATYKKLGIYEDHAGKYACNKCKSTNTIYVQHDTSFQHVKFWSMGSAEEPLTCSVRCVNCGARWKE